MQPALQLDHVTKRFGSVMALENVTLEVPRGVVYGLLGENGAGKTTAIRALLGLAEPDQGRAQVLGLDSQTRGLEIRRQVGYVSERPTMYEWMTVGEIGWFTAGFYGGRYLEHYQQLVQQYRLPAEKKLEQLSKGMRAKVALALALGHDPELLILDEPTSGLDTLVRRQFLESMVDRAASGKTVFLSSHQIGEVERVADMVAILRQGRVVVAQSLDSLKSTTHEVTLTLSDDAPGPPALAGTVIRGQQRGRQWQLLLRDADQAELEALQENPLIQNVELRMPDLETIFVAYMQGDDADHKPAKPGKTLEAPVS